MYLQKNMNIMSSQVEDIKKKQMELLEVRNNSIQSEKVIERN